MPIEITMPKLSDTMTDGTLVKWLKKENDKVSPGDVIAEVETDKATQELEAFEPGTVARIVATEGSKVAVGALIVVLAKPGEDTAKVAQDAKNSNGAAKKPPAAPPAAPGAAGGHSAAAPTIASPAAENARDAKQALSPSGNALPAGPQTPGDSVHEGQERQQGADAPAAARMRVSPLARKIATEKGVDLATVEGSGPDGRIIKRDILEAAARPQRIPPPSQAHAPGPAAGANTATSAAHGLLSSPAAPLQQRTIPLSNMRQTIARRLLESKQKIPHFYVSIDVQMDALLELRKTANSQIAPEKLSVTDFISRAVAVTITRVPAINASFAETAIIQHGTVNLGLAVAVDDGLVVPVIRDAQTKGVRQISADIKRLAELARTKKLKADQMTGGTFTISNLGMYEVRDFMAIINPPESAILAVGGAEQRAVVKNGLVVPASVMTLTLSADHRVVDGATGAKFLSTLKQVLENPLTMLI